MFNRKLMASRIAKKASILDHFNGSVEDVIAHFEYNVQSALSSAKNDIKALMSEVSDSSDLKVLKDYSDYILDLKKELDLKSAEIHRKLGK